MHRFLLAGLLLALLATAGCEDGTEEADRRQEAQSVAGVLDRALARQDSAVQAIADRFEAIDNLSAQEELRLRRHLQNSHMRSARALGVGRVADSAAATQLVEQNELVRLEDTTKYYYIQEINYSVPYVTPDMAALLDSIGRRFHERLREHDLPMYRFTISSLLRTTENQRALRGVNPNATPSLSTHSLGATIDVVYHDYRYSPQPGDTLRATSYPFLNERLDTMRRERYNALGMRYWQELKGLLGRVLFALQQKGVVKVTLERQLPVFHFTVAERLADT